uniref:Fcf2 domain-containing protein n=1 Tax=Trichuris muris TaxID=70415 RepID=A0A5S6QUP5_TRIMR
MNGLDNCAKTTFTVDRIGEVEPCSSTGAVAFPTLGLKKEEVDERFKLSGSLDPGCELRALPILSNPLCKLSLMSSDVTEAMKKAVVTPGFEKTAVLKPEQSKMAKRLARKLEREKTMGTKWFNMPATEMSEERKRDLKVLQLREVVDPTVHYRRNYRKTFPKYFEIGRVVDNPIDFYSSRIPKKQRKSTIIEELLADAEAGRRMKEKYSEMAAQRNSRRKGKLHRRTKHRRRR